MSMHLCEDVLLCYSVTLWRLRNGNTPLHTVEIRPNCIVSFQMSAWANWNRYTGLVYWHLNVEILMYLFLCVTFLYVSICVRAGWDPTALIASAQTDSLLQGIQNRGDLKSHPLCVLMHVGVCAWRRARMRVCKEQLCPHDTVFSLRRKPIRKETFSTMY